VTAWKRFEQRVCQALGSRRRHSIVAGEFAAGSDDDDSCWFAVEAKYSKRRVPEGRWIEQAKRQGRTSRRPWLLVVGQPGDRVGPGAGDLRPVAVLDFWLLVELGRQAGVLAGDDAMIGVVGDQAERALPPADNSGDPVRRR
jgi:hypothetical protein